MGVSCRRDGFVSTYPESVFSWHNRVKSRSNVILRAVSSLVKSRDGVSGFQGLIFFLNWRGNGLCHKVCPGKTGKEGAKGEYWIQKSFCSTGSGFLLLVI